MPSVNKGESQESYIHRCIPIVMKENGGNQKTAVGKCAGMYRSHINKHLKVKPKMHSYSVGK